jgi:hypothetical protein
VFIGMAFEATVPFVRVSNWNVGYASTVIRLEGVIRLENVSNWRFIVEKTRLELLTVVPVRFPF